MASPRPTPFDFVFGSLAAERFPAVQAAFESSGAAPRDRDAFLMTREVIQLIHELRPDDGSGGEIEELAAFVHHAWLFWLAGTPALAIEPSAFDELLRTSGATTTAAAPPPEFYVQFPERRLWAEIAPGSAPEPVDGCFLGREPDGSLTVLAALGMRPDRPGLSVSEVQGPRTAALARVDGSPLFSALMPGGSPAGLASLAGGEELLELGWRAWILAAERSGD
jgi:hypothetical protein